MVSIGAISRISGADFVKMENNAVMKNLVGSSFRTFEYTTVRAESTYLFKTESGRWGYIKTLCTKFKFEKQDIHLLLRPNAHKKFG